MPEGRAPHPDGQLCNLCFECGLPGHNLGCSSAETKHWFCSLCVVNPHACPLCRQRHRVCTSLTARETPDEDILMKTVRMLSTDSVWGPDDHIGGRHSRDVPGLKVLEHQPAPTASPPWRPARWQMRAGDNPTNWVPKHQPYGTVPRGSPPLFSDLLKPGPESHEH